MAMTTTRHPPETDLDLRRVLTRGVAVIAVSGVGLVHLVQLPDTARQTPGLAAMFGVLALASALVAISLLRSDHRVFWHAAALTALGPLGGYVLTRSVAVPFDNGDVGNWTEPLGLASLFIECGLLALCASRLRTAASAVEGPSSPGR